MINFIEYLLIGIALFLILVEIILLINFIIITFKEIIKNDYMLLRTAWSR